MPRLQLSEGEHRLILEHRERNALWNAALDRAIEAVTELSGGGPLQASRLIEAIRNLKRF